MKVLNLDFVLAWLVLVALTFTGTVGLFVFGIVALAVTGFCELKQRRKQRMFNKNKIKSNENRIRSKVGR